MTLWSASIDGITKWVTDLKAYPPHAWLDDPRDPIFTFVWNEREFGFYAMSLTYWNEVLSVMFLEGLLATAFSLIVFRYIIPRKRTPFAYLVGYGFIIPFWLMVPSTIIRVLGVRNKVFRFCISAVTPSLCTFRTTEAMHGFAPDHALQTPTAYMVYYGLPTVAKFDRHMKEYIPASTSYKWQQCFKAVLSYCTTGLLYSIYALYPDHFPQCGTIYDENYFSWKYVFSLQALRNSTFYGLIFASTLSTSGNGGNFVSTMLTGYEMEPFMKNPVFTSNTISEFWGKRWNKLIQTILARGIYRPLRTVAPTHIAMLGTFLVSGLFHEWLMILIFAPLPEELSKDGSCIPPKCFALTHGSAVVFFLWMAILVTGEIMFVPKYYFRTPVIFYKWVIATMAAWGLIFFLDPYVHTRFFNEGYVGYFMVHPVGRMP